MAVGSHWTQQQEAAAASRPRQKKRRLDRSASSARCTPRVITSKIKPVARHTATLQALVDWEQTLLQASLQELLIQNALSQKLALPAADLHALLDPDILTTICDLPEEAESAEPGQDCHSDFYLTCVCAVAGKMQA